MSVQQKKPFSISNLLTVAAVAAIPLIILTACGGGGGGTENAAGAQSSTPPQASTTPPTSDQGAAVPQTTLLSNLFLAGSKKNIVSINRASIDAGTYKVDAAVTGTMLFNMDFIYDMVADKATGRLYVADNQNVSVYGADMTLVAQFPGAGKYQTHRLALDNKRDQLYLVNYPNEVAVFPASTATNATTSVRRWSIPVLNPLGESYLDIRSIAVDATRDIVYIASELKGVSVVHVFEQASTLNGTVNPTKTISLTKAPFATGDWLTDITVDARRDAMYLLRWNGSIFALNGVSTKSGTVSEDRTLRSTSTNSHIEIDSENDRLYGYGSPGVQYFEKASSVNGIVTVNSASTSFGDSVRAFAVPQ